MKSCKLITGILFSFSLLCAQERVVLDENFESNHYSWRESGEEDFSTGIENGKYIMKVKDPKNNKWAISSCDLKADEENFKIETALELKKGDENTGYGLVFGMYNNYSDYKIFYITNTGYFKLTHYYSESPHVIIDWKKTDKVKKGQNRLAVKREFNCLSLYINDEVVATHCEFKWWGSKFGFIVSGDQKVEADYIRISAWPKKVTVAENALSAFTKENLGPLVNTMYEENSPVIAPDGKTLYWCTYHNPENTGDPGNTDIYYSELQPDKTWGKYKSIGRPLNNASSNWVISVSPDNNSLVTGNSYKPDGENAGGGISIAYSNGHGGWLVPVKQEIIGLNNVSKYSSYNISTDNKVLLMGIQDEDSYGYEDIYVSLLQPDGRWSKPMNIGSTVNTAGKDFGPFLAADGKTLYFASYGHESYGGADIFMTRRLDDTWRSWSKPVNLGPSINTEGWESAFSISAKGDYAYMVSVGNDESKSPDIFRIRLSEEQKPEPVLLVYGKVLNKKTNAPLQSQISYSDLSTNKEIGVASSNAADGSYKIILPMGYAYGFLASKEGFYPISENVNLDTLKEYMEIEKNLYLAPVEVGETIRLNNIFFDLDKATLKAESAAELDRLVDFLKKNATVKIELGGHTDNAGSDDYNQKLSQQRTESVKNYLADKGIARDRLSARGYGESKPVAANDTEEGRALNRRVEFSIQSR